MKIVKIAILVLSLNIIFANNVFAISIGVKPIKIDISQRSGEKKLTELLIKNTENEPALYSIYPDEYGKSIIVEPSEFKLDSNEEKVIKVSSSFWLPGEKTTDISVVARPLKAIDNLSLPGVKIPIKIDVQGLTLLLFFISLGVVVFLVKWVHNNFIIWKKPEKKSD